MSEQTSTGQAASGQAGAGETVTYEVRGTVGIITLNRPDALNSMSVELSRALGDTLERAAGDDAVRVVVLTGAGERAFCAGADLKAIGRGEAIAHPDHPEWGFGGFAQHWIDKPVIAAVNGVALGGGCELVLASDLAVMARSAKIGLPEVKVGLFAAAGGVIRMPRQVPLKRALHMVLTGDPLSAEQAYDLGLVNEVVDDGTALDTAIALAERISRNAPLSVAVSKRLVHQSHAGGSDWDHDWTDTDVWAANEEATARIFGSEDAQEGTSAFAEKRAPQWHGR